MKFRVMRPLKRSYKTHNFLAFDIETYNSKKITKKMKSKDKNKQYQSQKFLCGSVYVDNQGYIFWDKKTMLDFILQRKYVKYWKIATNLYFDMTFLIDDIENFKHRQFKFGRYNKHRFIDVLSFSSPFTSVKKQGNIIGLDKLNQPKSWLRKPNNYEEMQEISEYCIRDSEISCLFAYWYQQGLNELGAELKETTAQSSLDLFKRQFLKHDIYGDDDKKLQFSRQSYRGGRVETFKRGTKEFNRGECFYYDVNSLYPHIMHKFNLPDPSVSHWIHKNDLHISYIQNYEGCSECLIYVPESLNVPILPLKQDNKLLFPVGYIHGTWTHVEINYVLSIGCKLIKIYKQLIYKYCFTEYKNFIGTLYDKRLQYKNNNNHMEYIVKLMMNSSSGKLGQDNSKYSDFIHVTKATPLMFARGEYELIGSDTDGWLAMKNKCTHTPTFVNPIIVSYITALARIHMHKLFKQCEKHLIYTDTDSLIVSKKLDNDLISGEIGFLKIEHEVKKVIIVRSKMYAIIDYENEASVKAKGFSKLNEIDSFYDLIDGKSWAYSKMTKFRESIRNDVPFNSVVYESKKLDNEDNKRIWKNKFKLKEFQTSKPIIVDMQT